LGSPIKEGIDGQSLTPEDQLFTLMQAAQYVTATRGLAAPEMRICYERLASLCDSLNRPLPLYFALLGQWRYSLVTDKLSTTIQLAKRVYPLAQDQHDPALMVGAYRALAGTLYFLGDFETSHNPTKVEHLASQLIELSTRHNFAYWLAIGVIFRGWARSASGDAAEGIPWIEGEMEDFRATGSMLAVAIFSSTKSRSFAPCGSYLRSS
jgi:hypothetical protein